MTDGSGSGEDARTIFVRGTVPPPGGPAPTPIRAGGRLQPGDVLNGIYEVRRFVAAGGMGEVWEGVSVHSDERVAIKVMLPHLAQNPSIVAMFRKEAATLTRLAHPALVAYRMLAMEPVLGVLYIVTEFVDGSNLADGLRDLARDPATLRRVTRRLAEGLLVAHEAGAVHRDLSPDNVLLEGGDVARARIIDFGIAKDLDAAKGTIVGDGFAGKLGYVAPEQLGDFGRAVGPWTDVYSLGLVILAVAQGRAPDMGATLVDAVDRRRAGVDVTAVPEPLRAVIAAMLRADPAERLRSMGAVIAALDATGVGVTAPPTAPARRRAARPVKGPTPATPPPAASTRAGRRAIPARWLAGAGAGLLAIVGVGWWASRPSMSVPAVSDETPRPAARGGSPVADPLVAVRAALPGIGCAWLDARSVPVPGRSPRIAVTGAAGDLLALPGRLAAAAPTASIDTAQVLRADATLCPVIDALRMVRASGTAMLAVPKQDWELDMAPTTTPECAGKKIARIPALIDPRAGGGDWAMSSLDYVTGIRSPTPQARTAGFLTRQPDGRSQTPAFVVCSPVVSAWLLIHGVGPYDAATLGSPADAAGWRDRFLGAARAKHWTVELAWWRTKDDTPN